MISLGNLYIIIFNMYYIYRCRERKVRLSWFRCFCGELMEKIKKKTNLFNNFESRRWRNTREIWKSEINWNMSLINFSFTKGFPTLSWQRALQFLNVKLSQKKIVQYKYEEKRQKFQKAQKKAKFGVQLILFGVLQKVKAHVIRNRNNDLVKWVPKREIQS